MASWYLAVPLLSMGFGAIACGAATAAPQPVQVESTERVLSGTVTATGPDSITITPVESKESVIRVNEQGKKVMEVTRLTPPRPPIKLGLGKSLGSGERSMPPPYSYSLKDVKVGDRVILDLAHVNGIAICSAICITRRPGGRVPPAPGDSSRNPKPWHEYCQAQQDFEEKGTPIPEKFKPTETLNPPPGNIPVPAPDDE